MLSFLPASTLVVAQDTTTQASKLELKTAIQPRTPDAGWLYLSEYFVDGARDSFSTTREDVIQTKEIDGVTCYLVRLTFDWRTLGERFIGQALEEDSYDYFWEYFNEEGSYHYWVDGLNAPAPAQLSDFDLTLQYPVDAGASYIADGSRYTVLDTARDLSVPAGEFSCVVYQVDSLDASDPDRSREHYYMSPGVGLVRWEIYYWVNEQWVLDSRDDLVNFSLTSEEE